MSVNPAVAPRGEEEVASPRIDGHCLTSIAPTIRHMSIPPFRSRTNSEATCAHLNAASLPRHPHVGRSPNAS